MNLLHIECDAAKSLEEQGFLIALEELPNHITSKITRNGSNKTIVIDRNLSNEEIKKEISNIYMYYLKVMSNNTDYLTMSF